MCAVVKDQHKDVREWLDWNLALGVGRIYLFDNNSSAPMLPHMADLVAAGSVSYTFFATFSRRHYAKHAPILACPLGLHAPLSQAKPLL